jgi:hypothetical protein
MVLLSRTDNQPQMYDDSVDCRCQGGLDYHCKRLSTPTEFSTRACAAPSWHPAGIATDNTTANPCSSAPPSRHARESNTSDKAQVNLLLNLLVRLVLKMIVQVL